MSDIKDGVLDTETHSEEYVMLMKLSEIVKAFYSKPKNIQAFEAWKKNKEDNTYA